MKRAFSLTETLNLITILAIAIAAATPTLTRKIINSAEAGTTLSGGAHGRYEIFTKEILTTPDGDFEKSTNPSGPGSIRVYRRLTDNDYKRIKGSNPSTNGAYKQTLYEEINGYDVIIAIFVYFSSVYWCKFLS